MIKQNPDKPDEFEEVYTKLLNIMYDTLKDNIDITKYYRIDKARNAIVFEPPSRETKIDLDVTILVVSTLESLRKKYPIEITKDNYNNRYIIMVDKIKYRKYIIQKLIK